MRPGIGSAIYRFGQKPLSQRASGNSAGEKCGQHHTKTHVVVPVVRIVPIAAGTTHVPVIIVERPATNNTGALNLSPEKIREGTALIPPPDLNAYLFPPTQQTTDLNHHFGNMLILTV